MAIRNLVLTFVALALTAFRACGNGGQACAPPPIPIITCKDFGSEFAPCYLGDGFIGLRPGPNPLLPAKTVVAGYVFSNPNRGFEMYAPAPYPLGIDLRINGADIRENPAKLTIESQTLDMGTGELTTRMIFAPGDGLKVRVDILQFLSRSTPSLVCQQVSLTSSADAKIELLTAIDHNGVVGSGYRDQPPPACPGEIDQVVGWHADRNKLGIALAVELRNGVSRKSRGHYIIDCRAGQTRQFREFAAMVSEFYSPDPDLQAIRLACYGVFRGFDSLRAQNRQVWAELWKSRVKVYGSPDDQRALDAAFFYVHSSAHAVARTGVPPFGLSQWSDYFGHIFWDQDTWIFQAVLLADPKAAQAMLNYRFNGLEAARKRAASYGFRGAMYPWEGGTDGSDTTDPVVDTGFAEQHTSIDVALAFWEYYLATGDKAFLRRCGWPVLEAVAEWLESRGEFTARGFEIRHIMGPNENLPDVNNDAYLNLMSKNVMIAAVDCASSLNLPVPSLWRKIAKSIYIPMDETRRIVLPRDETPDISRAYSLGIEPYFTITHDSALPIAVIKRTFDYQECLRVKYLTQRSPGFVGPPCALAAAIAGNRAKAAELFRHSWSNYLLPPYLVCKEYQDSVTEGCYLMNLSSLLQTTVLGFTGLRINGGDWRMYPASLPAGWTKIEIDRIWVRGRPMKLVAESGQKAQLIPTSGMEGGDGLTIEVPTR